MAESKERLAGLKVLLVDDSDDNQILVTHYLKRVGASVDVAFNGLEGVQMAQQNSYDVILMDIEMPKLDGYRATNRLRAAGLTTPIVGLTAHDGAQDRERALANGFSAYLIKPLTSAVLIETLTHYVSPTSGELSAQI